MQIQKEMNHDEYSDRYIKWFSELNNKDIKIAGGKGASLSEMFNAKFPVPPGYVITTSAFEFFMTKNMTDKKVQEIIESINIEETEKLQKSSKEIRTLIESQEMPKELEDEILEAYHILGTEKIDERGISSDALNILKNAKEPIFVSVRSSATTEDLVTASFAGQQDTFLNIKGDKAILENVKKCFSSLYTARAIYYRNKQGFKEGEALLSVIIQKMIDSEKSGVIFSKDPTNKSKNIIVEAVYGLGEGIVSGRISPDHYTITDDLKIEKIKTSMKKIAIVRNSSGKNEVVPLSNERAKSQVLTNGEILEAADYALKLEAHYQKPQDIEFAIENKKLYIIQSRPITTIKETIEKAGEISGNIILTGLGSSPGIGAGTVKIIESMDDLHKIKKGDILVTKMTNPDMVVAMEKSTAIVTNEGGMTSHASIVSREMGIPCVVGTDNATSLLKNGTKITVDGSNGKIYEGEVAETTVTEIKPALETERIKLKLIVDLPNFAERAAESKIDTIGLTRIEGIIAGTGKHPLLYEKENNLEEYTKILVEGLEKILKPFKKIWIRSSDIRTDEYASLKGAPEKEINPMLGFHGIRFSLKHPKIFEAELNAIKQVAEKNPDKKVGVMFPQIISIEEVIEAKKYYDKFKKSNMEFGVMIETPASVQIIDDICQQNIDFISFGTNDLTQFTLGVDRGEEHVQHLYNELHPSIISQIKRVIGSCKRHRVETSICGQAGSKKEMVKILFKKGISSISVNADAAYDISKLIRELEQEREKEFKEKQNIENKNKEGQDRERQFKEKQDREKKNRERQERERQFKDKKDREEQDREKIKTKVEPFIKQNDNFNKFQKDNKYKKHKKNKNRHWDKRAEVHLDNDQQNNQQNNQQKNQQIYNQDNKYQVENIIKSTLDQNNQQSNSPDNQQDNQQDDQQDNQQDNQQDTQSPIEQVLENSPEQKQMIPQLDTSPEHTEQPTLPKLPTKENQEPARLPPKNEGGFLNQEKIQISAEHYKQEPQKEEEKLITGDFEDIKEKIEKIHEQVEENIEKEQMKEQQIEDNISIIEQPVTETEQEEETQEEVIEEPKDEEDTEEEEPVKEQEEIEEKDTEEEEPVEDLGIYKPNEEQEEKPKYKYNFDNFEDYE